MFGLEKWRPTRLPVRPTGDLEDFVSRFFNEPFMTSFGAHTWSPSCDLIETGDEIRVVCDLPGMKRENIEVQITSENTLMIRGERTFKEREESRYHRMERFYGNFTRTFVLPVSVNPDRINATFKDGVLEIVVPKAESAKARKIAISE
jgi:HSP20 family protein